MIIPVYIVDMSYKDTVQKQLEENEILGFKKNDVSPDDMLTRRKLVDLHFKSTQLHSIWVDPDIDDDTRTKDIIMYIGSESFRTPYSNIKFTELINLLAE